MSVNTVQDPSSSQHHQTSLQNSTQATYAFERHLKIWEVLCISLTKTNWYLNSCLTLSYCCCKVSNYVSIVFNTSLVRHTVYRRISRRAAEFGFWPRNWSFYRGIWRFSLEQLFSQKMTSK